AGPEASISGGFADIDSLVGGTGTDTLTGTNAAATWQVGATEQYTSGNTLSLNSFENLVGGNGSDRFLVAAASSVTVAGSGGNDVLDFSTLAGSANVVLRGADATGFSGTGTVAFAGIDTLVGSNSTGDSLADSIASPTSSWNLAANPTFSDGTHTLSFSRIDDLTGAQKNKLAFGPPGSTTPRDLTLRYIPATQTVQLVDSVTSAIIASTTIN